MTELHHQIFAALSIVISIGSFAPYIRGIYNGSVRPHLVGWLIWSLLTALVFIAQLVSGGGAGAWTTATISLLCCMTLGASVTHGDKSWTAYDKACLTLTLLALPLWVVCQTPLYSVILLTFIEFLGFAAMTPKTWKNPEGESLSYFSYGVLKYALGALALRHWTWETALYPTATAVMAGAFALLILARRLKLAQLRA